MCHLSLVSNAEHCRPELTRCRTEWGWLKEANPGGQSRRRNHTAAITASLPGHMSWTFFLLDVSSTPNLW